MTTCRVWESLLTWRCRAPRSASAVLSSRRLLFKALRAAFNSRCKAHHCVFLLFISAAPAVLSSRRLHFKALRAAFNSRCKAQHSQNPVYCHDACVLLLLCSAHTSCSSKPSELPSIHAVKHITLRALCVSTARVCCCCRAQLMQPAFQRPSSCY